MSSTLESKLNPADAVIDEICLAGDPWAKVVTKGQTLRIVDIEGNQAVDTIFYSAADVAERYSLTRTIQGQGALYLTMGSVLMSSEGRPMMKSATCTAAATASCWRCRTATTRPATSPA
jgi:uncharacterized protein YcgI (DUF1989 family)